MKKMHSTLFKKFLRSEEFINFNIVLLCILVHPLLWYFGGHLTRVFFQSWFNFINGTIRNGTKLTTVNNLRYYKLMYVFYMQVSDSYFSLHSSLSGNFQPQFFQVRLFSNLKYIVNFLSLKYLQVVTPSTLSSQAIFKFFHNLFCLTYLSSKLLAVTYSFIHIKQVSSDEN